MRDFTEPYVSRAALIARCEKLSEDHDFAWECTNTARAEWQAMFDWTVLLREELKKTDSFVPQPPPPYLVKKLPPRHAEVRADWLDWKEEWESGERAVQRAKKLEKASDDGAQADTGKGRSFGTEDKVGRSQKSLKRCRGL